MFVCPRTRGPLRDWYSPEAGITYPVLAGVPVLVEEPRGFLTGHRRAVEGAPDIRATHAPDPITPHLAPHLLGAPLGLGQWFASLGDLSPDGVGAEFGARLAPDGPAVDVGCGTAPMARRMVGAGRTTYAFDRSPDVVLLARSILAGSAGVAMIPTHKAGLRRVRVPFTTIPNGLHLAIADAARPPLPPASFAWVHLGDVLDSAGDAEGEVLVASAELVTPGGLLTLHTAFDSKGTPKENRPNPEDELLEALESLGFTPIEQSPQVPHVVRRYDRAFEVRFMYCVAARRR